MPNKKIKIPVYIIATASKYIGDVEVEKIEDYNDAAMELLEESGEFISENISNDFEIGDTEIEKITDFAFKYYKEDQEK